MAGVPRRGLAHRYLAAAMLALAVAGCVAEPGEAGASASGVPSSATTAAPGSASATPTETSADATHTATPQPAATPEPAGTATAAPGCGPAEAVRLDERFTPLDRMLTRPTQIPILSDGKVRPGPPDPAAIAAAGLTDLPAALDGQVVMASYVGSGEGAGLSAYYGTGSIGPADTFADVLARGGIMVIERPTVGKDAHVVDASLQAMGSWAGIMRVGSHDAAVVHADPIDTSVLSEGVRPYYIYWSDGVHDWEMRAGTPDAGRAIEAARTIACR